MYHMKLIETRTYVMNKLRMHVGSDCVAIEKSILEYTKCHAKEKGKKVMRWSDIDVRRYYLRKYRSVMFNIEKIKVLLSNEQIEPKEVAMVHHYRLCPQLWDPILEKHQIRYMNSLLWEGGEECEGLLKCVNEECNSMKTKYVEVQTRGGDEPLTVFARCMVCSTHWTLDGK